MLERHTLAANRTKPRMCLSSASVCVCACHRQVSLCVWSHVYWKVTQVRVR